MWQKATNYNIQNYSRNFIDMVVEDSICGKWRLIRFYGYPEGNRRRNSLDLIHHLSSRSTLSWCIVGDFNDIFPPEEKRGRVQQPNWLINGFRQAVLDEGLVDVPMQGYLFTWFKILGCDKVVEEKLDKTLVNNEWCSLSHEAKVKCLTVTTLNHYPILLSCEANRTSKRNNNKFKFESVWLIEQGFNTFFVKQWRRCSNNNIVDILEFYGESMMERSKENCYKLRREINKLR